MLLSDNVKGEAALSHPLHPLVRHFIFLRRFCDMNMETQIREALARGYCSPENEHKILDPVLIEAMTRELLQSFTPAKTDKVDSVV